MNWANNRFLSVWGLSTRARALCAAGAALAIWAVHWAAFSRQPGDAWAFVRLTAVAVTWAVLCGAAWAHAAGLSLRQLSQAALAPAIGLLWCVLAYFIAMRLRSYTFIWPLMALPFALSGIRLAFAGARCAALPALPNDVDSWRSVLYPRWPMLIGVGIAGAWLTVAAVRISYPNLTMTPDGLRAVSPYVDQASYLANATVLMRQVPPENHDLAGVPLRYHYFGDLLVAAFARMSGAGVLATYRFIFPLLLAVLFGVMASLAWRWSRRGWAVVFTLGIVIVGGDFTVLSTRVTDLAGIHNAATLFARVYLRGHLWGNPSLSWLNSLPQLAGTTFALAALGLAWKHREEDRPATLLMAAVAVAATFKFKSPHFAVLVAGLLAGGAYELWRERTRRLLTLTCLAILMATPAALGMAASPERPTLQPALFPYFIFYAPFEKMPAPLIVLCGMVSFLGLRLLAFVPFGWSRQRTESVTLFACMGVGMASFLFAAEPSDLFDAFNTVWPARFALTLLAVPAGAGLVQLLRLRTVGGRCIRPALILILVIAAGGGLGAFWTYPGFIPSFVHPDELDAFRVVRQTGLDDSLLLSYRRRLFASALTGRSFYVNPWGLLAYTRRNAEHHRREREMWAFLEKSPAEAEAWLRERRIEFIFTSHSEPIPARLASVVLPVHRGAYGILWRARWAADVAVHEPPDE